jgi:hypothetical protein
MAFSGFYPILEPKVHQVMEIMQSIKTDWILGANSVLPSQSDLCRFLEAKKWRNNYRQREVFDRPKSPSLDRFGNATRPNGPDAAKIPEQIAGLIPRLKVTKAQIPARI